MIVNGRIVIIQRYALVPRNRRWSWKNENAVLLQTASSYVADLKESKHTLTKTLCDPASQQSYMTESVKKAIGLLPMRRINVNIKAFRDMKGHMKTLREDQVVI